MDSLKFFARPARLHEIIYGQRRLVFHMLRIMLQDPASKNPDERFYRLLHSLLESHSLSRPVDGRPSKGVERVMKRPPWTRRRTVDGWFFEQYRAIDGSARLRIGVQRCGPPKGFLVRGKLIQKNVPDDFILSVPIL